MKATKRMKIAIALAVSVLVSTSCMKEFLDVKRNKAQVIPVTLEDYRLILENHEMNAFYPILGEIGSDDYYVATEQWKALSVPVQRNGYIWADEVYEGSTGMDWNYAYERILYSNFVLEGVSKIDETPANKALRDELIGAAQFYRGINFFLLAQLYCKQYDAQTANDDLGLPLRTTSNINARYPRASLAATYSQIIGDLEKAAALLPAEMTLNTRPWKAAAWGMLAIVNLQIGDYEMARNHADQALRAAPEVVDYNGLDMSLPLPFPLYGQGNGEIIFYYAMMSATILTNSRLTVDSLLYDSYHSDDLRKGLFFFDNGGRNTFKGHYSGNNTSFFAGLTTPELLLIRAECNARFGNAEESVADLTRLLEKRYRNGGFEPLHHDVADNELLQYILSERRKELVYRGRRWHDLKRFTKEPLMASSPTRKLDGLEYTLPIDSRKWVWPIPPDVINLGGLIQNER